jgi:Salt tolerance down-regulator
MTMQRLVETAQGTSAGMTESMTENIGLVDARALRNGKSKKKKKKSVNKSNLGSLDHDALNDDDDHPVDSILSHAQEVSSRQQLDDMPNATSTSNKRKKKKKKSKSSAMESIDNQVTHSQPSTLHSHNLTLQYKPDNDSRTKFSGDNIWSSNNNSEERQRIREFWLQLGEDERRSLVKVEKEAVLKKMKEQQKHSCNCSVCGKKR